MDQKTINYARSVWLPILIGCIASTFYIYDFIVRVMPAAMADQLMANFHIAAGGFGLLASLFFWGYAIMQIPVGTLCDRYSPRFLLAINILICALATALFSVTKHYTIALICRFVIGFTASFAYIGALKIGANWFPAKRFAMYAGMVQFLGCMGAIVGETPVALLTDRFGWRHTGLDIACLGIFFAALIWFVVRNLPGNHDDKLIMQTNKQPYLHKSVFTSTQTWWAAAFGFAIWVPIVALATTWGIQFFQSFYGISNTDAANLIDFIWVGIALGGPAIGWFSDHIQRRKVPMATAALLGLVCSCLLIYVRIHSMVVLGTLLFFYGVSASAMVLSFGLMSDIHQKHAIGTAAGFTNMAVIFSGVLVLPLVGFILNALWSGNSIAGVHIYDVGSYQKALTVIPMAFLLAFVISSVMIRETFCRHKATQRPDQTPSTSVLAS